MEPARKRLSKQAIETFRRAIADSGGNEIFVLAAQSEDVIREIRVLARGNRGAVPALLQIPRTGEVVLHNHPSGALEPSDADLSVASQLGNTGVGFYIVDNAVERVYVVVEAHRGDPQASIDEDQFAALLERGGVLASALDGYEHRPQQLELLRAVVGAFNQQGVLLAEAGTGTGKSLAYLIPSIAWSTTNRQRVIVSTHTINLQEQLIAKDLPLLAEKAGLSFTSVLVKGRRNYLCQRKAAQVGAQGLLQIEDEIQQELQSILAWSAKTKDGSLSDLNVRPRPEVWEQVVSESDNCLRARCPFYDNCFFYRARRAAAAADVLVVNHHLLLSDLALRRETDNYTQDAILPPAKHVVVDEAHHLHDVATSHFGYATSHAALERTLSRLRSRRDETRGVLPSLVQALDGAPDIPRAAARAIEDDLLPRCDSLRREAEQAFGEIAAAYAEASREAGAIQQKVRVTPELQRTPLWRVLRESLRTLASAVDRLAQLLQTTLRHIESFADAPPQQVQFLLTELSAHQGRLLGAAQTFAAFLEEDDSLCRWLEYRRPAKRPPAVSLHAAPIAIAEALHGALFTRFETAVLTSATLTIDRRFDHLRRNLGIDHIDPAERVEELRIDSPFDFPTQALLLAPSDIPAPGKVGYDEACHAAILRALTIAEGGCFVLFTSYGALNRAVTDLGARLRAAQWTVLQQGSMPRAALLERFRHSARAALFATDSFWEGVDVKGDALRCVIIARLPFRVPSEPIEQARVEHIKAAGGDAFAEHTIPQAVLKLKQGFGRLVRSRDDRGCVLVLDSRIATRRYGRLFLHSLPPATQCLAPRSEVFERMREFFATRKG